MAGRVKAGCGARLMERSYALNDRQYSVPGRLGNYSFVGMQCFKKSSRRLVKVLGERTCGTGWARMTPRSAIA